MARAESEDFLQAAHFAVYDLPSLDIPTVFPFNISQQPLTEGIPFVTVQLPETVVDHFEVREGNWPYTRRVPMRASTGSAIFSKGVLPADNDFAAWTQLAIFGGIPPHRNLVVLHLARDRTPKKAWMLEDCVPTQVQYASDFDANSAEISIATLTLQVHMVTPIPIPL